jgi:heat-inducible transcriptional repressor
MADLSEMGYLEQPHTSAGRVPSQKGYRFYIDKLMPAYELDLTEKNILDSAVNSGTVDTDILFRNISSAVAKVTRLSVAATTPNGVMATVRAVQFVQTSRRTAMIVLMASTGTIKTKIFHCDFDLTPDILRIFFRIFNEKLIKKRVIEITPAFVQSFAASLGETVFIVASALSALVMVANDTIQSDVCVDGQMNLLFCPEYAEAGFLRVMHYLDRPREFANLICNRKENMTVMVGKEIGRPELNMSGLVAAKYFVDEQEAGAIGIIGPMRMNYGKCIAVLSYTIENLGKILTRLMEDE